MTDTLEDLRRKLKKSEAMPGYEARALAIRQRIAEIEGNPKQGAGADTITAPEARAMTSAAKPATVPAVETEAETNTAETSPEIASEAGKLMHHEDPKVRRVAASAVRQAKPSEDQ
jgi:hypothetical protein